MTLTNLPPSTDNRNIVRSFLFPFQLGSKGLPAMANPQDSVFNSIVSLLTTAKQERVMRPALGVNLYDFIFENLSLITQARVASGVTQAIEEWEPRATILSVTTNQIDAEDGVGKALVIGLVYRVGGETETKQVILQPPPVTGA